MRTIVRSVPTLAFFLLAACEDSAGPRGPVSLSFAAAAPGVSAGVASAGSASLQSIAVGPSLVITRVELVLSEVELARTERTEAADCDGRSGDDACEKFTAGPMLVDLPLDGSLARTISVTVPQGEYDELELEVDDPDDDDASDRAFVQAHPDFANLSVRVTGTYDGQPVSFTSRVEAEVEMTFPSALQVGAEGGNVTVQVSVADWFRTATGAVLDPRVAANRTAIEGRIVASLDAFEDDDRDGRHDGRDDGRDDD